MKLGLTKFYVTGHDALEDCINMKFSTKEVDNDEFGGNCATAYGGSGGNWYRSCHEQNLNGKYGKEGNAGHEFMSWTNFDSNKPDAALQKMRWMLREVV